MGRGYARNSRSQRSIGTRLIDEEVRPFASRCRKAADLGCGPGTLTAELSKALPGAAVIGLDRDEAALARARRAVPGLRFARVDFRRPPSRFAGRFDLVFSNEAMHWTRRPPRALLGEEFFYRFLGKEQAAHYRNWGEDQWLAGLRGVTFLLRPGGRAVLQFGGRGQLQELFEAMARAFEAPEFAICRGAFRYPTYYPTRDDAVRLARRAGLRVLRARAWTEILVERTPREIVDLFRACTEPALGELLPARSVRLFYRRLEDELRRGRSKVHWRRVLLIAER